MACCLIAAPAFAYFPPSFPEAAQPVAVVAPAPAVAVVPVPFQKDPPILTVSL